MPERVVKGGKMGEGDQGIQFNYKISHRGVMYSMVTVVNDTVADLTVGTWVHLRSLHHKKKISNCVY